MKYETKSNAALRMMNEPALRAKYPRITKFAQEVVAGCYSDTYKEVYGMRPGWAIQPLDVMLDDLKRLQDYAEEAYAEEVEREDRRKAMERVEKEATKAARLRAFTRVEFSMAPAFAAL